MSGSHDNVLLVWNLLTGAVEQELLGHRGQVTTVKISRDGSIAISGTGVFLDHGLQILSFYEIFKQVNWYSSNFQTQMNLSINELVFLSDPCIRVSI